MDVDEILSRARRNCHTTTSQWPDATHGIDSLNETYKEFTDKIRAEIGEHYFFKEWKIDAVDDQTDGEYDLSTIAAGAGTGPIKITRVDVKPTTDYTNYIKAIPIDPKALAHYGWDWFLTNQPHDEKVYHLLGGELVQKIRIAPNWTNSMAGGAGNNQIKITGERSVIDLVTGGAESTIHIPSMHHRVLILGCEPKIFKYLGKRALAQSAEIEYQRAMADAIDKLSNRVEQPTEATIPETMADE